MDKEEYLMLDFRINTFLTVCQTMNFTKAAEELHITQPTVSQHIHYLEDYYETSLFTYQNRQLALTWAGKTLQERLLRMKNDETTIQKELHENNERIKTLSIGVTMTIGEYAISGALAGGKGLFQHAEGEGHGAWAKKGIKLWKTKR